LTDHIAKADLIVTTAAVPGRKAPRLIDAEQIARMKPGAVIVDMGAEGGGNCEGTKAGETVKVGPTTLIGPVNLPSSLAEQASELYSKNILNLLEQIIKDGKVTLDMTDEVIAKTLATHDGAITAEPVREAVEGPPAGQPVVPEAAPVSPTPKG
ncbi:MAG: NAD(P)(+) transhydrogenase (Re/Si-specific) subunit alpha, partial [Acetobacter papayae]